MFSLIELKNLKPGTDTGPKKNNAHIHLPPNFSAFDNVEDALSDAKTEGIRLLGASNYYDYRVYEPFILGALTSGIYPVLGMEIVSWINELATSGVKVNDPGNPGKAYICGKGIVDIANPRPEAKGALNLIRSRDSKRSSKMIAKMEQVLVKHGLPTGLTETKITRLVASRHGVDADWVVLQERHIAMAFQQAIFAKYSEEERKLKLTEAFGKEPKDANNEVGIQGELRSYLMKAGKAAYVEEQFISIEDALKLIRDLDGLPCYPTLADGVMPICGFEQSPEALISNLKKLDIRTAEFIPGRNEPTVLKEYVTKIRQAGIVVGAGTEHNTLDRIAIEPKCVKDQPIPDECQAIFWEAACVFAAHQHRILNGQPGFEALEAYNEEAIKLFASEGATLIGGMENNAL